MASAPAHAQAPSPPKRLALRTPAPPPPVVDAPPAPATRSATQGPSAPGSAAARAADAFDAGTEAFAAGDFAAAVVAFERAQALLPHPATAFNLGLALQRAGRRADAWAVFRDLERAAADPNRRRESAQKRQALEAELAILRVVAPVDQGVCFDGQRLDADEGPIRTRAVAPGSHRLEFDLGPLRPRARSRIDLVEGEQRVVEAPPVYVDERELRARRTRRLAAGAIGSGWLAVGLGLGSAGLQFAGGSDSQRSAARGLAWATAGSALVAASLGTSAWVLHRRETRARDAWSDEARPGFACNDVSP